MHFGEVGFTTFDQATFFFSYVKDNISNKQGLPNKTSHASSDVVSHSTSIEKSTFMINLILHLLVVFMEDFSYIHPNEHGCISSYVYKPGSLTKASKIKFLSNPLSNKAFTYLFSLKP
jgi:hypothetical protein